MNKATVLAGYALWPALPAYLYLRALGLGLDAYGLSVVAGAYALTLASFQPALASRPAFLVRALGERGVTALHGAAPLAVLALALVHRALKASLGFPLDTVQASLGSSAFWLMLGASAAAILFIARLGGLPERLLGAPLGSLRKAAARLGFTYKVMRALHGAAVLAVVAVAVHAALASSADASFNLAGLLSLAIAPLCSLVVYVRYRLLGRKPGKVTA